MLFNSEVFLTFAICFFPVLFFLPYTAQRWWILAASYVFYGWWDWRFLALIGFSSVANHFIGQHIFNALQKPNAEKAAKQWVTAGVVLNLGFLGFFKYYDFFAGSLETSLATMGFTVDKLTLDIVLPVGISFFTFQAMSYVLDIYRRRIKPDPSLLTFAVYIALFPQLVAGPIVRAAWLLPQLQSRLKFKPANFIIGAEMIALGLWLKVVLADNIAPIVDSAYAVPGLHGGLYTLVGATYFSMQLYGDFAGYSMIAIGLGRLMSLDFDRNFKRPFLAHNISDFWRRWHISLSSWLRDYLYISLGGNRGGQLRTYRNLFLTMLLGGLWHGAAWTMVFWGALHGSSLAIHRGYNDYIVPRLPKVKIPPLLSLNVRRLMTLTVVVAWFAVFRATSMDNAWAIFISIADFSTYSVSTWPQTMYVVLSAGFIFMLVVAELLIEHTKVPTYYRRHRVVRVMGFFALVFMIAVFGRFDGGAFIYFQF